MNKIVNKYLIFNFLKIIGNASLFFICAAVTMNLFEEIEFFKNLNVGLEMPFLLTGLFVPNIILVMLPFIIFLSSIWFFISIGLNRDLLTMKVFGYSNLRIVLTLGVSAFFLGIIVLIFINPMTSLMTKYYENIKADHSRDVEHLFAINKNGLWIKEKFENNLRISTATELKNNIITKVAIFDLNLKGKITRRIEAEKGLISSNDWLLQNVKIFNVSDTDKISELTNYTIKSSYSLDDLNTIYKNLDTVSFFELITKYKTLIDKGYPKNHLDKKLNSLIALPIYLFLMVLLAAILAIKTSIKIKNFYYIFISILTCVVIYYLKDLSLAIGLAGKISLVLSVWMPIILISIFCTIGVMQINEK
jgi:lipopolysaccharide export system permease protein